MGSCISGKIFKGSYSEGTEDFYRVYSLKDLVENVMDVINGNIPNDRKELFCSHVDFLREVYINPSIDRLEFLSDDQLTDEEGSRHRSYLVLQEQDRSKPFDEWLQKILGDIKGDYVSRRRVFG